MYRTSEEYVVPKVSRVTSTLTLKALPVLAITTRSTSETTASSKHKIESNE